MWKSKRHTKKERHPKTKQKIIYVCAATLGILVVGFIYAFRFSQKSLFVSPLPKNPFVFSKADATDYKQAQLKQLLEQAHLSVSSITGGNDSSLVTLSTGEQVLFSDKKDLSSQVSSLQLIYSRLTIEGKAFSRLDLRFDKPVLISK